MGNLAILFECLSVFIFEQLSDLVWQRLVFVVQALQDVQWHKVICTTCCRTGLQGFYFIVHKCECPLQWYY